LPRVAASQSIAAGAIDFAGSVLPRVAASQSIAADAAGSAGKSILVVALFINCGSTLFAAIRSIAAIR
jgi:hypothetical protein